MRTKSMLATGFEEADCVIPGVPFSQDGGDL